MSEQIKNNKFAAEKKTTKKTITNKNLKKTCQKIQEKFLKLSVR